MCPPETFLFEVQQGEGVARELPDLAAAARRGAAAQGLAPPKVGPGVSQLPYPALGAVDHQ